ncbi:MAG TPA: flagellar basal body-associated FliL family protein [Verrucomicrobiae bacterium]|nr:flagellar basal body-associated FliL family protein [Verrucomicrobiae bacterium]
MADETPETPAAKAEETAEATPTVAKSGGGIGPWLPLIVTVVAMPALAYAMTAFVLLPNVKKELSAAVGAPAVGPAEAAKPSEAVKPKPAAAEQGATKEKGEGKGRESASGKTTAQLDKILVNVAGTMGSRYLLTSLTLAGGTADFEEIIKLHQAQLVDLAAGILSSKSVADLEKPDARTTVRSELITVFNNALGAGTVQDIYLTEFAIQ